MLMGPVFRAELLRTGRQKRYYALRLIYGLVLLVLVWTAYEQLRWRLAVIKLADVAQFAATTFMAFGVVQLITVLLLVPAVFGGAIADEKQRKTLHYLMASQLSSREIILDKVLGRSAHLVVFLAIGLPIVCLLGLFGGISVESVVVAYIGTFSTLAFAVTMTVLVSTWARRVREAILSAYLLMLIWLVVPPLILLFGTVQVPRMYLWIRPVNDWLSDSSPLGAWIRAVAGLPGPAGMRTDFEEQFLLMVGLQLAGALLLLLLAIWRLRPIFRRQEETPVRRNWFRSKKGRRRRRWFTQPPCGDDPIVWKERHFAPVDRFTRVVLLPAIIVITLPLALMTEVEGHISRVFVNFWELGFGARHFLPYGFRWALQVDLAWYVGFWLMAVAGAAASAVTIEREKDTWVSLTATPLTGGEILRGKVQGAIWNQRGFAAVLAFVWALALITGAADPLAILGSIALVALLTWLVATVGIYCSLRARNTSRAMGSALMVLAVFNGYPVLLYLWFLGQIHWDSSYPVLGLMPSLSAWSMAPRKLVNQAWAIASEEVDPAATPWILSGIGLGLLLLYAGIALALTIRIVSRFDRWLDRPPLASEDKPVPAKAPSLEELVV